MRSKTGITWVVAWVIALMTVLLLSLAPISPDWFPESAQQGFGLGHLLAYAMLTVLTLRILLQTWKTLPYRQTVLITAGSIFLYGGAIELLQPLVGRQRDVDDLLMNAIGIAMALACLSLMRRKRAANRWLFSSDQ